ncbi:MAG: N-acetylmuramoyl-L-alanine amidase [Christensenellaceae bacterium]|jgi:N-acetylmuramoyl-L-alanine amidase
MEKTPSRMERRKKKKLRVTKRFVRIIAIAVCVAVGLLVIRFGIYADRSQKTDRVSGEQRQLQTELQTAQVGEQALSDIRLEGLTIIVDAGHGGDDIGCIGRFSGRYEKEINLEIAQKLEALLAENGAEVIMTRQDDDAIAPTKEEDMAERERIILESSADMFISVHQNEFDDEAASGPQVFFVEQGSVGKRLAVAIQEMMNQSLGPETPRMALPVAYQLLKPGSQPSCTVECGFMSNEREERLLQEEEYQQQIAAAITDGVKLYKKQYLM